MIEELRKIVKHSGIYGIGLVSSKAVGFIMIPVYTRFLAPGDYGTLELLDLLTFFATNFATLGIEAAVFRFYAAYDSEQEKKEVIATALLYATGGSFLCALVLFIWADPIARQVLGSSALSPLVRIVSATFFFSNLCEVPLAHWRAQERSVLYVSVNLARTLLGAASIAVALAALKWGVRGILYANLLTNAIAGLGLAGSALLYLPRKLDARKLAEMLRYSVPLFISGLGSFVLVFSDRFFLRRYGDLTQVGIYALGYKLAMIVNLVVGGPFRLTWQWQQFELAKKENAKVMYAKIQIYQLLVSVSVGLAIALLAKDALRILSPTSYWGASQIVPIIAFCYVLDNVRSMILSGVLVQRMTHSLIPIAVAAALINVTLNFLLIPHFLAMGAAVATLLSYLAYLAMTHSVAQRAFFIRYEYGRNLAVVASAGLVYLAGTLIHLELLPSILVNLLLFSIFAVTSFNLLDQEERSLVRQTGVNLVRRLRGGFEGIEKA
ncbi:MAG: oligosaccharide flippase family protein [Acidobacteria bacterium]|nr:oligosaccharide flippase family protein [Acidobacteriota bacterium]